MDTLLGTEGKLGPLPATPTARWWHWRDYGAPLRYCGSPASGIILRSEDTIGRPCCPDCERVLQARLEHA